MLDGFKPRLRAAICARRISTFAQFHTYGQIRLVDYAAQHTDLHTEWFLRSTGIIHCSQRGQPSHAAVEGEFCIKEKGGKFGWDQGKCILLLPDLQGKG